MTTIVATFSDPRIARDAAQSIVSSGLPSDPIGIVMANSGEARQLLAEGPGSPAEGAKVGATVGGSLAGLSAIAVSVPFGAWVVGPLVALLGGATAGGLLGALAGMGIPENEAAVREKQVQDGGALLTYEASADDQAERVAKLLETGASHDVFRV